MHSFQKTDTSEAAEADIMFNAASTNTVSLTYETVYNYRTLHHHGRNFNLNSDQLNRWDQLARARLSFYNNTPSNLPTIPTSHINEIASRSRSNIHRMAIEHASPVVVIGLRRSVPRKALKYEISKGAR